MARFFGLDLLSAPDQDRHSTCLQPGNQCSGGSRDHGQAGTGGASYARWIAAFRRSSVELENISRLQVQSGIGPGLSGRNGERVVSSGCRDLELGRSSRNGEQSHQEGGSTNQQGKGLHRQTPGWTLSLRQPKNNIYYHPGSRIAAEWQVRFEGSATVPAAVRWVSPPAAPRARCPRDSRRDAGATGLRG